MKIFYIIIISILFVSFVNAADTGSISINTDPISVDVYLDNQYQGLSPLNIENVIRGNHTLVFNKEGYNSAALNIFVESNIVFQVTATLTPGQGGSLGESSGSLSIVTNPTNANLYLNGIYQGSSPRSINSVAIGTHELKVNLDGYYESTQLVSIFAGQTTSVYINLIPINQQTETGSLKITTYPSGADIRINNVLVGSSPLTINNLPVGYQYLKASKTGYNEYSEAILIYNGLTSEWNIMLSIIQPQNNTQGTTGGSNPASNPTGNSATPGEAGTNTNNPNSQATNPENPDENTQGSYENGVLIPEQKPILFQSPEARQNLLLWVALLIFLIVSIVTLYIFFSTKK